MKIEPATVWDVTQLDQLINACFRGEESKQGWTSELGVIDGVRSTPAELRQQLRQPGYTILKCTDEDLGQIISCVLVNHHHEDHSKLHVGMLCVLPNLQAQGLGKKMMEAVEDHARKVNCPILNIDVVDTRTELIAWYERRGFVKTGKILPFPEDEGTPAHPLVLLEMEKTLE